MSTLIQIITALLGSFGFALMFNLGMRNAAISSINGMCTWIIYVIIEQKVDSIFISAFVAAVWAAVFAEVAARIMKAPANQYLIVGIIPLLPGAPLYYTLSAAFAQNWQQVKDSGNSTLMFALGIAAGICVVCGLDDIIKKVKVRAIGGR